MKKQVNFDFTNPSNGLDIFPLLKWSQIKSPVENPLIMVSVVPRGFVNSSEKHILSGGIDLFGTVRYEIEDGGKPLTSVLNQGTTTFGKRILIPLVEEVYKIALSNEVPYVDLQIHTEYDMSQKVANKVFWYPKLKSVAIGKDSSDNDIYEIVTDIQRRDNVHIYPLTPVLPKTAVPVADVSTEEDALVAPSEVTEIAE